MCIRDRYKRDLKPGVWLGNWIDNTYNLKYLLYVDTSKDGQFMTDEGKRKLAEIRRKLLVISYNYNPKNKIPAE